MRRTLIGKNTEITPQWREYRASKVVKLYRLLSSFSAQLVSLQVSVQKNLQRNDYSTSLTLHFPQHPLHPKEQSRDWEGASRTTFR